MDLTLSREQSALRDAVRELYRRALDPERLRAVAETERGWSLEVWTSLADTGVLGIAVPEELGGAGAGVVEVATVMAELGRVLAPEPVLDAVVLPAQVLLDSAEPQAWADELDGLASGRTRGALAQEERGDRWPYRGIRTTAEASCGAWVLRGGKRLVRAGDAADILLVTARADDGIGVFIVDAHGEGVTLSPYRSPDRRRGAHVRLDAAPARRVEVRDVETLLRRAEALQHTALCAEAVGVMDEALRITTDYLGSRRQFGTTLSSFQVLAHRLADLHVLVEMARSMSLYATAVIEDGTGDPAAVSRAALQVCRAARQIGHESIHLHGGIGVTDEYVIGQYAARLMTIEAELGGAAAHLQRLAAAVDEHDRVVLV